MIALRTLPGQNLSGSADTYFIVERAGTWTLRSHYFAPRAFRSIERLAHTLGGIVPWERWDKDAQDQLQWLGVRGAF